jgi:hypothetical protein
MKRFEVIAKQRELQNEILVEISYIFFTDRALDWYNILIENSYRSTLISPFHSLHCSVTKYPTGQTNAKKRSNLSSPLH